MFTVLSACFVVPGILELRRYDIACQPVLQKRVCEAARDNQPERLNKLIHAGADPDSTMEDANGNMLGALTYASIEGNEQCVEVLLKCGASPSGAGDGTSGGTTALDYVVLHNRIAIMARLLNAGANAHYVTWASTDKLVLTHNYAMAELLLKAGLDRLTYDSFMDMSSKSKDTRMLSLLKKYPPAD